MLVDILTLHVDEPPPIDRGARAVAVADAPPRVSRKRVAGPNAAFRASQRTLAVRHVSGHHLVALIEIVSPANKDRPTSVRDFVEKVHAALRHGCHVLLLDLFPHGLHDPHGMHAAVWEDLDPEEEPLPNDQPLSLASYMAGKIPEAYVEPLAVGAALPEMPLFLETSWYLNVPLEATYEAAYRGMPAYWRGVLEGRNPAQS